MTKKKPGSKFWFLFILGFPLVGLVITVYLTKTNLKMPRHYIVDRIIRVPDKNGDIETDTIFHRVRPFALVNQLGDTIGLRNIDGRLALVNFFQIDDSTVSKKVALVLKKMANSFARSDTGIHILSISTDPVADSVQALLSYAFKYDVNHSVWWFLRGSLDSVKRMAKTDFHISLKPHGRNNMLSSSTLILLDRFQHVRGYYDALDSGSVQRCVHDLSRLMIEKEKLNGIER